MGKNYKEKQAYLYLHGFNDSVSMSVQSKWDRKNFERGRSRADRKRIKEKDIDKLSKNEQ